MRRVDEPAALEAVAAATCALAERGFGDSTIYLERLVTPARHIEVQVFGFGDGQAAHLHERDCSVQRRYQKVVEEAPAPGLGAAARQAMAAAAVALARRVRYRGAGTVEFVVAPDEHFFFLEMNTRIQVEHPVTEMLTGGGPRGGAAPPRARRCAGGTAARRHRRRGPCHRVPPLRRAPGEALPSVAGPHRGFALARRPRSQARSRARPQNRVRRARGKRRHAAL